ncbi:beta-N-acetylhexosaminidase [Keratinibaculum paraultunense]|uniref:Beta-N-acetylhexosaminidase n=1 Tax=Keratinibaculum paraultunense TaxID=1278232 RepID=A0A4R3KYK7_9FIRM|nr:beta-N-acetylhexosaminidase [Keratinibaculum paraultunense]QQY78986.1 beta-N-acetylhexosaminidase [Keratinibaculum paraultunense]TCS90608.1 beta-N-acetylhexosaminidase [Keratinibaculum paraultunense]
MRHNIYIVAILILMIFLSGCSNINNKTEEEILIENDKKTIDIIEEKTIDPIQESIENMDLDEKIGQLFIVGFNGTSMDNWLMSIIEDYHIGGFILFRHNMLNVDQTIKLLNDLKEENKINPVPLFLSIDEEGGRVKRLPSPFLNMPSAKQIGNIDDKDISYQYGKILAKRIKSLGFNMNFAPVFDINSNFKNLVIGDRSFGSNVDVVIHNGIQVMKGISSENIIPIIKHFPGHGDTSIDSHKDIPVVDKDLNELKDLELVPFLEGIKVGADGIMIGHIMFPKIDDIYPASLSKEIITNLLRKKLSFNGVIISDDMTMGAITRNYALEDAAVKYLKAGGDILLIGSGEENVINVIHRIKDEVKNGNITEEELNEKLYRILELKEKYNIIDKTIQWVDVESINQETKLFLDNIDKFNNK